MDFSRYITGYAKPEPKPQPLRVWGKNPGEPAACFEVETRNAKAAITEVRRAGFKRAFIEVK